MQIDLQKILGSIWNQPRQHSRAPKKTIAGDVTECDMAHKSSIIVPLYVYPFPEAWLDLYRSIEIHSETHFWVIINPDNGPGPSAVPDENYLREISKLNSYSNVGVLGYIHVSFTTRKLSAVLEDIDTYSRWTTDSDVAGLSVQGIFVDETPNQFSVRAQKFLRELKLFAKSCSGLGPDCTIVHNPGSIAPTEFTDLAEITVIFEDTLQVFQSRKDQGLFDQKFNESGRESKAVMIHSISASLESSQRRDIAKSVEGIAEHVFFTDLTTDYYQSFSPRWLDWATVVAVD